MNDGSRTNAAKGPYYLSLKIGLITLGLLLVSLAMLSEGVVVVILVILAGAVIVSAFTRFPAAIASYVRSKRRPRYETFFAILSPLAVGLITAWLAWSLAETARIFGPPGWTGVAAPVPLGIGALMNLGVLVSNVVSLRRR